MNTPVSFEIAKLLKEKGFSKKTLQAYVYRGVEHQDSSYKGRLTKDKLLCDISAPTIAEVVMWLYEKNIWISVDPEIDTNTWFHTISHGKSTTAFGNYSSPIEAYEKGIEHVLNSI